jgi:hypothetical protein
VGQGVCWSYSRNDRTSHGRLSSFVAPLARILHRRQFPSRALVPSVPWARARPCRLDADSPVCLASPAWLLTSSRAPPLNARLARGHSRPASSVWGQGLQGLASPSASHALLCSTLARGNSRCTCPRRPRTPTPLSS